MQAPTRLSTRLVVSLAVGLAVFAISCAVAYRQYCGSAIRYPQSLTLGDIRAIRSAIEASRQERHSLPQMLHNIPPVKNEYFPTDRTGVPTDWWRRPFNYWTDGTHYRIVSYGYDGKPGGVGLDYDLSSDDLEERQAGWHELPRQATPTFGQFLTDRGGYAHSYGFHGSGFMMFLASILTGLMGFMLGWQTIGGRLPPRGNLRSRVVALIATVAATLYVAAWITAFHAPSGH